MAAKASALTALIKRQVRKRLLRLGYQIQRLPSGPPIVIPFWDEDPAFDRLNQQLIGHTLVDKVRCYMIYQAASQVASLHGDIAEIGVYKGGTAKLLCKTVDTQKKAVHL